MLTADSARDALSFQTRNRELFERYEPTRPDDFYTLGHQRMLLRAEYRLALKLQTVRFYVFLKEDPSFIVGTVCLHDIIRLPFSCCEVGYKFDREYHHRGFAREAVRELLRVAFYDVGLHRVFARVVPDNEPSIRLLEDLGFSMEGMEKSSVLICGEWTDHLRYALISPID